MINNWTTWIPHTIYLKGKSHVFCPACKKPFEFNVVHAQYDQIYQCGNCLVLIRHNSKTLSWEYKGAESIMKEKMNKKYAVADPFGVKSSPADAIRKSHILATIQNYIDTKRDGETFDRALDIGCGEGWITVELPTSEIVAFDISDAALSRIEGNNITTVDDPAGIDGKFDLILAAGVMVEEYDYRSFLDLIENHASGLVVICQNAATEVQAVNSISGEQIAYEEFAYGAGIQRLRCFDYASKDDPDLVEPETNQDAVESEMLNKSNGVESPITDATTFTIKGEIEERNF